MSAPESLPNPAPEQPRKLSTRQWLLVLNICVALGIFGQYLSGAATRTLLYSAVASFLSLNATFLLARKYGKEHGPGPGQYPVWAMIAIAVGLTLISLPSRDTRWKRAMEASTSALRQRQFAPAEKKLNDALQIAQKFGSADRRVIATLNELALLHQLQGKAPQAEATLRRIAEIQRGANSPDEADTLSKLALFQMAQRKPEGAEPLLKRALEIRARAAHTHPAELARAGNNLASFYRAAGKPQEAESLYQRSLSLLERDAAANPELVRALLSLGELRASQRDFAAAESMWRRAIDVQQKAAGREPLNAVPTLKLISDLYVAQNRLEEAAATLQHALALQQRFYAARHASTAPLCNNLAWISMRKQNLARAEDLFRYAAFLSAATHGPYHPEFARALAALAAVYWAEKNHSLAQLAFAQAIFIAEKRLGDRHPETLALKRNYEGLMRACKECRPLPATEKPPGEAPGAAQTK